MGITIDKRNLLAYKIESGNHYKIIPCMMVLRLMDTAEYSENYCRALDLVLELFLEISRYYLDKWFNFPDYEDKNGMDCYTDHFYRGTQIEFLN